MNTTRLICSLALAFGLALPAQAQFNLMRLLSPGPAAADAAGFRQHAEAVNAILQKNAAGDIKEALRLADALVAEDRKAGDASPLSPRGSLLRQSLGIAANLHERDGNYARAIELQQMLLATLPAAAGFGAAGDAALRLRIGELQLKAGDFEGAKRSYQALLAGRTAGAPSAKVYAGLGTAALRLGDDALAESSLLLAIRANAASQEQAAGSAGQSSGYVNAMAAMSAVSGLLEGIGKSLAAEHAILDSNGEVLSSVTGKPQVLPTVLDVEGPLTDLAFLYYRRGDAAALNVLYLVSFSEYAARAERMDAGLGPPAELEKQYARFGAWLAGLKQYELARQAFDSALRLNARRLSAAAVQVPPEQLPGFFSGRRQILDLAISQRLAERADAAAWRATLGDLLQSKGLQSDFLARRARVVGRSKDAEIRGLAAAMEAIDVAGSEQQYLRRANLAVELQQKVGKLLPPLEFQAGDRFIGDLQRRLDGETLLSLFVFTPFDFGRQQFGPKRYLGAKVSRDGIRVADLGSAETLDGLGAGLRADLAQRPQASQARAVLKSARGGYDALLKPLIGARAARGAYVADLDGAMSLLPMEALADGSGRYLIEDTEWRYVGSARVLMRSAAAAPATGRAVVLADPAYDLEAPPSAGATPALGRGAALQGMRFDPLPQTLEEGKAVAASLRRGGIEVDFRAGAGAGMEALATLHAPRYLHIATHGFFVDEAGTWRKQVTGFDGRRYVAESYAQGRSSGLALAGANPALATGAGDGIVYAAQLRQLDLDGTELAVLSACDTSVGAISLGEGVDSLRQALDVAGVASTVTSLWPVPDAETRSLMTGFYDALASGAGKSRALRQAKLGVRKDHPHPYYWAAFVVSGMR